MGAKIVGLIVGLSLIVITPVLMNRGKRKSNLSIETEEQPANQPGTPIPSTGSAPEIISPPVVNSDQPDDFTIIEGIGPKISEMLQRYGIQTFAQLATTDGERLKMLFKENELEFVKPESWPEQARLAAEGKMDELRALQRRLVAGR